MENKKEYLNEEIYEKGKKKLKTISLIILIVGILFGASLIVTGIVKTNAAKAEIAEKEAERTESDVQTEISAIDLQIDAIDVEINDLELEKERLQNEKTKIFQEDFGFSDRYYAKDEEIKKKENEIELKGKEKIKLEKSKMNLKNELWNIQSGFNSTKNSLSVSKYVPLYMFGGFIIVASCMVSLVIYLFAKKRDIAAFTIQQTMPLAQEGIEKMASTVGKAGANIAKEVAPVYKDIAKDMAPVIGDIAKEVSGGIKEGFSGTNDDKKQ